MGLGIAGYSRLELHVAGPAPRDLDATGMIPLWVDSYAEFASRADGLVTGWYRVIGKTCHVPGFSYSGYGAWRRWVARVALDHEPEEVWRDHEAFRGRPFYELINFADNEGTIGPTTSAKLARDFRDHLDAFTRAADGPEGAWNLQQYMALMLAFELAADGGAVRFA